MSRIEKIIKRCEEIIEEGKDAIKQKNYLIMAKAQASIENIYTLCYSNNIPPHYKSDINETVLSIGLYPSTLQQEYNFDIYLHRFIAFKTDLEKGMINNIENIVSLDLFDDMIEQAKSLRKQNIDSLNRAACVLARIVLEDTIKKLCKIHKINPPSDKASAGNDELKKRNIYSTPQHRFIQAWLDVGNVAAHPNNHKHLNWSEISEHQMDDMIKGILEFSLRFLS